MTTKTLTFLTVVTQLYDTEYIVKVRALLLAAPLLACYLPGPHCAETSAAMRRWMMMSTSGWIASGLPYCNGAMQMPVSARRIGGRVFHLLRLHVQA